MSAAPVLYTLDTADNCLLCCLNVLHMHRFTQLCVVRKAVERDSMSFSDCLQFRRISGVHERPQGGTLR